MTNLITWLLAALAGLVLGGFFFGCLWWSVVNGLTSSRPGWWQLISLIVRMGVTLIGFYLIGGGGIGAESWQRLLSCLLGFMIARFLVVRLSRVSGPASSDLSKGAQRASQS